MLPDLHIKVSKVCTSHEGAHRRAKEVPRQNFSNLLLLFNLNLVVWGILSITVELLFPFAAFYFFGHLVSLCCLHARNSLVLCWMAEPAQICYQNWLAKNEVIILWIIHTQIVAAAPASYCVVHNAHLPKRFARSTFNEHCNIGDSSYSLNRAIICLQHRAKQEPDEFKLIYKFINVKWSATRHCDMTI